MTLLNIDAILALLSSRVTAGQFSRPEFYIAVQAALEGAHCRRNSPGLVAMVRVLSCARKPSNQPVVGLLERASLFNEPVGVPYRS